MTIAIHGAAPVPHLGVIRVEGTDAATFLHGQLTQDFALLGMSEARLAAWCSAKGRVLATFVGFKRSHTEILLVCQRDILPAMVKRLSMFVLRAKAKISDASGDFTLYGMLGSAVSDAAGSVGGDFFEHLAVVGEHGGAAVGACKAIRGPVEHGAERHSAEAARCLRGGFRRREAHSCEVHGPQAFEPALRRERRHTADVDHGDARDEPQHEQHAQWDAEVAMREDQGAAEEGHGRSELHRLRDETTHSVRRRIGCRDVGLGVGPHADRRPNLTDRFEFVA